MAATSRPSFAPDGTLIGRPVPLLLDARRLKVELVEYVEIPRNRHSSRAPRGVAESGRAIVGQAPGGIPGLRRRLHPAPRDEKSERTCDFAPAHRLRRKVDFGTGGGFQFDGDLWRTGG